MAQRINQDLNIGQNLRALRLREGLTQEQVAEKLQLMGLPVSREIYAQMETGQHHIRISVLMGLKRVFHTTYDEMMEPEGKNLDTE